MHRLAHRPSLPVSRLPHRTATRSGTVIRTTPSASAPGQPETTFLGPDAAPDPAALRACANFLDAQPAGQLLALCGSFPGWSSPDFDPLRAALTRWLARGTLAADTYGPPLAWAAAHPLALIKINADELRAFAPDLAHLPATVSARRWIVTDGPRTVTLRDADGSLATLTPPAIREVSPTGSGDVLFACVLIRFSAKTCRFATPFSPRSPMPPPTPRTPVSPSFRFPSADPRVSRRSEQIILAFTSAKTLVVRFYL
jgi:fructose-1-phosphate kinase PfkB-like protein